ncbi:MAG: hypothetical protein ACLPND_14965, partial [Candidatus Korobacteraceae bacterium]
VVRRRGTVDSLRHSGRWLRLLRSASPRYCVYAAGLNAVSSFEFRVSSWAAAGKSAADHDIPLLETRNLKLETALSWLPIAKLPVRTTPDERDIAEAILWNYREFLVETRA